MTSIEAGIGVGRTSARAAVSAPPWVWIGVTAGVVALVAVYLRTQRDEVPDYLDPNQPPLNIVPDYSTSLLGQIVTAPGQDIGGWKPKVRYAWDTLMESPCSWVGDC